MNSIIYLLVGTYTLGLSEGIYLYTFDMQTGCAEYVSMAKVDNPSYMAISADSKYIYSVTENGDGPSYVNALFFDKTAEELSLLYTEKTEGSSPCHIAISPEGDYVVTANYGGGSLSVFAIQPDKKLSALRQLIAFEGHGADPDRQAAPHLHCVIFSPEGNYLFAADLGTDHIYRFNARSSGRKNKIDEDSKKAFKVAGGSGPRHIVFHPSGNYLYLISELSGEVTCFNYSDGDLSEFQTIRADTLYAKGSADISITPDGNYLYASNRLQGDGIAIFSIDPSNGRLTKTGYQETGIHPRNLIITPNGNFLLAACRDSNLIEVFAIDKTTGLLHNTKKEIRVDQPVCLKWINK